MSLVEPQKFIEIRKRGYKAIERLRLLMLKYNKLLSR